jgi:hypothetical protein
MRPLAVDCAPGLNADFSDQSVTSVATAPHTAQAVIDKIERDADEIGFILYREAWPIPRV